MKVLFSTVYTQTRYVNVTCHVSDIKFSDIRVIALLPFVHRPLYEFSAHHNKNNRPNKHISKDSSAILWYRFHTPELYYL